MTNHHTIPGVCRLALGFGLCSIAIGACGSPTETTLLPDGQKAGRGTATIDGTVNDAEWGDARVFAVFDAVPQLAGSTLLVMNDSTHLYVGLRTRDGSAIGDQTGAEVRFDNTRDGVRSEGDDQVGVSRFGFADNHIVQGNYERDARSDGSGALAVVDGRINAELAHPLASGDAQDVSFTPGQRIAICVRYVAADLTMGAMPTGCHLGEAQNYFELDLAATN